MLRLRLSKGMWQTSTYKQTGFTLVELVIVIILISILSISVFSRFTGTSGFAEYAYQARLISALRNMQTRAMHDNRDDYCFKINFNKAVAAFGPPPLDYVTGAGSAINATCGSNIEPNNPDYLRTSATEMSDDGVVITTDSTAPSFDFIAFDGLGRPIDSADELTCDDLRCKITLTGESAVSVCIESQGYIHACE